MAFNRRGFLKFVAGGAIGTGLTPIPWKLIDDVSIWTQNWPWIPNIPKGNLQNKPSLVKLGASEYGISITTVDEQPITAAGRKDHPLSQGGIDPLAAASVQMLYSPARIAQPMLKEAGGKFRSLSWDKAMDIFLDKLAPLQGRAGSVACITGDETSSAHEVLSALLDRLGSAENLYFMPSDSSEQRAVWQDFLGGQGSPGYDLDQADLVLCLNADLLESWGTAVRNQKALSRGTTRCIYAGPALNNTAAIAEEWVPVQADRAVHLALSLASLLLEAGIGSTTPFNGALELADYLKATYPKSAIPEKTGLPYDRVAGLAERLVQAQQPLVIAGTLSGFGGDPAVHYAGFVLNALLGRINAPGGLRSIPTPPKVLGRARGVLETAQNDLCAFISRLANGRADNPDLLLVYEANPMYALPETRTAKSVLRDIPFKVSFSQFMDETAAECDLILPAPYFLERLDDAFTPFGSGGANYSLAEPVVQPSNDSRPTPDVLLNIMQRLGPAPEVESYRALLKAKASLLGASWSKLRQGQAWQDRTTARQNTLSLWNETVSSCLDKASAGSSSRNRLALAVSTDLKTGTARTAIPPFGLSTLSEDELDENGFAVRMNPATAGSLNLSDGDRVKLSSGSGTCRARLHLDEGVVPEVVIVPSGFGHSHWDEFSRGKGDNAFQLLETTFDPDCGRSGWSKTRVQVVKET